MDPIRLSITQDGDHLVVSAQNTGQKAVTVVAHAKYLIVEMRDARGNYVRGDGEVDAAGMPSKKDYPQLDKGSSAELARLSVSASDGGVTISGVSFKDLGSPANVRITYKGELLMPNLPKKQAREFVRGPVSASLDGVNTG